MRLPNTAHTSRPWRIHELTPDFRLEDVWALPTPGGPDDFPRLVQLIACGRPVAELLRAVRTLFAIRWKLGELLGWDEPGHRPRLPGADAPRPVAGGSARRPARPGLRRAPLHPAVPDSTTSSPPRSPTGPCTGSCTSAGSRTGRGGYRGQMAVYVKPNGLLGQRLHGRDQAVPAPDRLPADAATDRADVAGGRERADGGVGVNAPLIVAGSLAILGAAIHGVGGEVLVVRKLSPETLPSSRFGGPVMTKTMIHVTWHMTTIAFLTVGSALLLSGSVLHGDAARALALVAAAACTGFAALALGMGGASQAIPSRPVAPPRPRRAHRHRGAGVVGSSLKRPYQSSCS